MLAFGIRLMPLSRQRQVIEQMRAALHPPPGVTAELTGLPVLAADAEGSLASSGDRLLMTCSAWPRSAAALLARTARRATRARAADPDCARDRLVGAALFALRIPLNPMSATLGTLVIAITTEFSVLLSERSAASSGSACTPQAIGDAYRRTGIAVLTSAVTAIAGFAVLVVSNITMLRDFGLLAVVDLAVSLVGVMLVLPATTRVWSTCGTAPAGRSGHRAAAEDQRAHAERMIDTRRYQWMIGGIGLVLVLAFSTCHVSGAGAPRRTRASAPASGCRVRRPAGDQ